MGRSEEEQLGLSMAELKFQGHFNVQTVPKHHPPADTLLQHPQQTWSLLCISGGISVDGSNFSVLLGTDGIQIWHTPNG